MRKTLDMLQYKCWVYDVAADAGTMEAPRQTPPEDMPREVREAMERAYR